MVLAFTAAIVALATTPFAFVVLGRTDWFKARRGRVLQRPAFSSVVVGMLLVMGIPAIFAAFVVKSRSFDRDRYEFDPNRTWSVLEQGRGYRSVQEADAAVKAEMERLSIDARTWSTTSRSSTRRCWGCGLSQVPRWRCPSGFQVCCSRWLVCGRAWDSTVRSNCLTILPRPSS